MQDRRRLLTTAAFLGAFCVSVAAGEESLSPIELRQADPRHGTLENFDLPVEPMMVPPVAAAAPTGVSLAAAAEANDYAAFAAAYAAARGDSAAAYADLRSLWAYQLENPVGAWYGADMYDRLARAYPRYASYIADFAIVDSRGQTFYPSTETRHFLLEELRNGSAPRRALASPNETRIETANVASAPARRHRTTSAPSAPSARSSRKRFTKAAIEPKSSPVAPARVVASLTQNMRPSSARMAATAPVAATGSATVSARSTTAPRPRVVAASLLGQPRPVQVNGAAAQPTARGLMLLVLGVAGVGFLTLLKRLGGEESAAAASQAAAPSSDAHEPSVDIETLKDRTTARDQRPARRATGSHG
jgi:hypothetical protein